MNMKNLTMMDLGYPVLTAGVVLASYTYGWEAGVSIVFAVYGSRWMRPFHETKGAKEETSK